MKLNNKLISINNIVISIISYKEKNWNLLDFSADPDPHQNEADPKH